MAFEFGDSLIWLGDSGLEVECVVHILASVAYPEPRFDLNCLSGICRSLKATQGSCLT